MTHFFAPMARSFAIASLTGAALLAGSAGAYLGADNRQQGQQDAARSRRGHRHQARDRRAAHRYAKAALKITPDQEPKWTAVAQAMRDSSVQMEKLVATKRAIPPEKTTAVDDLKTYQEFTEVRLEGLKKVNSRSSRSTTRCRPNRRRMPTWCSRSTARRSRTQG